LAAGILAISSDQRQFGRIGERTPHSGRDTSGELKKMRQAEGSLLPASLSAAVAGLFRHDPN
jgi:hypothetical protein